MYFIHKDKRKINYPNLNFQSFKSFDNSANNSIIYNKSKINDFYLSELKQKYNVIKHLKLKEEKMYRRELLSFNIWKNKTESEEKLVKSAHKNLMAKKQRIITTIDENNYKQKIKNERKIQLEKQKRKNYELRSSLWNHEKYLRSLENKQNERTIYQLTHNYIKELSKFNKNKLLEHNRNKVSQVKNDHYKAVMTLKDKVLRENRKKVKSLEKEIIILHEDRRKFERKKRLLSFDKNQQYKEYKRLSKKRNKLIEKIQNLSVESFVSGEYESCFY